MNSSSEQAMILSKLESYPKSVTELYTEAFQLFTSGKFSDAADKVEAALKELDGLEEEDKQTWGFAELQFLYGRSLLEMIKCSASNSDEIFGPKVPKVVGLHTDSQGSEEEEEDYETEDTNSKEFSSETNGTSCEKVNYEENDSEVKSPVDVEEPEESSLRKEEQQQTTEGDSEESKESVEEEQDIRELAWEQLECARVIFTSQLPETRLRLALVYEALGDFGMENDNNLQAVEDYKSAVKCYEEAGYSCSRMVGGLYHSIYLALRPTDPNTARKYLKLAAEVFEKRIAAKQKTLGDQTGDTQEVSDDEREILEEIKLEITDFDAVISNQEKENSKFENDSATQVTRVEPRKRTNNDKDFFDEKKAGLCESSEERIEDLLPNKKSKIHTANENQSTEQ